MQTLNVSVAGKSYPISVGVGLESQLLEAIARENPVRIAVITDAIVKKAWGKEMSSMLEKSGKPVEVFAFAAGEKNKNQKTVTTLQNALLKKKYGRDTLIITFGGGVVGDLGGFVAATYMRGVPFIQVPTTVLAMVDSSIGGKVGIDTIYGKNTIGSFYQPKAVIADLRFIETQKPAHIIGGLMEAFKTFITSDKDALELAERLDPKKPAKDPALLEEIIARSLRVKVGVVERDETEKNERMVVNFGHTIGHAIELLSKFKIAHGYCVGYGILAEIKIAETMGILHGVDRLYIEELFKKFGVTAEPIRKFAIPKILAATRMDKKSRGGHPQYVILREIGSVNVIDGRFAQSVPDEIVSKALKTLA